MSCNPETKCICHPLFTLSPAFSGHSDVRLRDVGHTGVSWILQLLVGTCSSAGHVAALEAAGVNYSEMEIDLQHHTQINPPSL